MLNYQRVLRARISRLGAIISHYTIMFLGGIWKFGACQTPFSGATDGTEKIEVVDH